MLFNLVGTCNLRGISPSSSRIYLRGIIPGSVKLVSSKKDTVVIKNIPFMIGNIVFYMKSTGATIVR